jgi:hypothetical protein
MMANSKDSAGVVRFLSLYSKLKDWCDDDPEAIFQLAIADKQFKDLRMQVLGEAERLHASEQHHRQLFAAPVDPKFLSAWRDFEERYEHILAANWSTFVFGDENADVSDKSKSSTSADRKREHADLNAKIAADLIEKAIGFARVQAFDDNEPLEPDYSMSAEEAVEMAIDYWEGLTDEIGFDLAGVFRRRRLVPFVFFPRHIAARHGAPEKTSIYQSLQQAHDAFIFGVPFAALALMRCPTNATSLTDPAAPTFGVEPRRYSVRPPAPFARCSRQFSHASAPTILQCVHHPRTERRHRHVSPAMARR